MPDGFSVIAEKVDAGGLRIEFDFSDPHTAPAIMMHLGEIVVGNGFTQVGFPALQLLVSMYAFQCQ
jgi:hypothetical protein